MKESKSLGDIEGRATLMIERLQGTQGLVNVQWRLNAEAQDDFVPPLEGTLQFIQVSFLCGTCFLHFLISLEGIIWMKSLINDIRIIY